MRKQRPVGTDEKNADDGNGITIREFAGAGCVGYGRLKGI